MKILILPISGGRFVTQLASTITFTTSDGISDNENNFIPDIIFAASGGNLVAYITEAARWNSSWIYSVASKISSNMFISKWSSSNFISTLMAYFKSNYYNYGTGVKDIIEEYFTPSSIQEREIWTGTFNKTKGKATAFCNKGQSILNTSIINSYITCSLPVIYNNGNIEAIVRASIASASIPSIVPPQIIDGEEYEDCGIFSASPLIMFEKPIIEYAKKNKTEKIHMIYMNSVNLDSQDSGNIINIVDNLEKTIQNLVNSKYIDDRKICFDIFETLINEYQTMEIQDLDNIPITNKERLVVICKGKFNPEIANKINKLYNTYNYSFLEIYPEELIEIKLENFDGNDVIKGIERAKTKLHYTLWLSLF